MPRDQNGLPTSTRRKKTTALKKKLKKIKCKTIFDDMKPRWFDPTHEIYDYKTFKPSEDEMKGIGHQQYILDLCVDGKINYDDYGIIIRPPEEFRKFFRISQINGFKFPKSEDGKSHKINALNIFPIGDGIYAEKHIEGEKEDFIPDLTVLKEYDAQDEDERKANPAFYAEYASKETLDKYCESQQNYPSGLQCSLMNEIFKLNPEALAPFADWNLRSPKSILRQILNPSGKEEKDIGGITKSWSYFGYRMIFTEYHTEDFDFASLNKLLDGFPQLWLIVPSKYGKFVAQLFEKFRQNRRYTRKKGDNENEYEIDESCSAPWLHRTIRIAIEILIKNNIPCKLLTQYPGDYVLTLSGCHHEVIKIGPNISEAVNIIDPFWLKRQKDMASCDCHYKANNNHAAFNVLKRVKNGKIDLEKLFLQYRNLYVEDPVFFEEQKIEREKKLENTRNYNAKRKQKQTLTLENGENQDSTVEDEPRKSKQKKTDYSNLPGGKSIADYRRDEKKKLEGKQSKLQNGKGKPEDEYIVKVLQRVVANSQRQSDLNAEFKRDFKRKEQMITREMVLEYYNGTNDQKRLMNNVLTNVQKLQKLQKEEKIDWNAVLSDATLWDSKFKYEIKYVKTLFKSPR